MSGAAPHPDHPIRISVAIVTRNRPDWLRRTLTSWKNQSVRPFEIVVSDDSDDRRLEESRKVALEFGCRHVRGPQRGLYANRNSAALNCLGTHILTGDDDHTHPANYLSTILDELATDPGSAWTYPEKNPDSIQPGSPVLPELRPDNRVLPPIDPSRSRAIADGSTVYPKRIFDQGLRYDERYRFGGLWHLWGVTLNCAGFRIRNSQSTFVWHHTESSSDRFNDLEWLRLQSECNAYVVLTNALVSRNPFGLLRAMKVIARSLVRPEPIPGAPLSPRLGLTAVLRLTRNAFAESSRIHRIANAVRALPPASAITA